MSFADDINTLMGRKGITQSQLANILGVSRQAVQFWASGRSEPKGSNLAKYREYARSAGCPLSSDEGSGAYHRVEDLTTSADVEWTRVPVLDVYASCGGGSDPDDGSKIVEAVDFYDPFLRSLPGVVGIKDNFQIIHSTGDSMDPTITRHAVCLIDTRQNDILFDGIYCIQAENQIFLKRVLRNFDGSITLISDNSKYPPQHVAKEMLDSAKVIGRVVYVLNGSYS